MKFLCECRGPCRRILNLDHDVYRYLSTMGAVLAAECAEREHRDPVHQLRSAGVVVVGTISHRHVASLHSRT
jgi:hypothetical protein